MPQFSISRTENLFRWWLPGRYTAGGTLCSLDPTGKGKARWSNRWKAALNALDIAFDGRVSAGRG